MRVIVVFAALSTLALPIALQAKPAPLIQLDRIGKWEVNYDADACHLLARLGQGEQETILRITRFQPQDSFDLTIYGKPLRYSGTNVNVTVDFGLQPEPIKRGGMLGTIGKDIPLLIINHVRLDGWDGWGKSTSQTAPLPEVTPQQEASVSGFNLEIQRRKRLRFETGSMAAPMEAMRACLTDLIKHWGYDPIAQAQRIQEPTPIGSPGDWLVTSDYPTEAVYGGKQGIVQFRLDIDETGKATGCHILYRTNPDEFADITCRNIMRRARLQPALDAQGKPIKSYYINKVRWILP